MYSPILNTEILQHKKPQSHSPGPIHHPRDPSMTGERLGPSGRHGTGSRGGSDPPKLIFCLPHGRLQVSNHLFGIVHIDSKLIVGAPFDIYDNGFLPSGHAPRILTPTKVVGARNNEARNLNAGKSPPLPEALSVSSDQAAYP